MLVALQLGDRSRLALLGVEQKPPAGLHGDELAVGGDCIGSSVRALDTFGRDRLRCAAACRHQVEPRLVPGLLTREKNPAAVGEPLNDDRPDCTGVQRHRLPGAGGQQDDPGRIAVGVENGKRPLAVRRKRRGIDAIAETHGRGAVRLADEDTAKALLGEEDGPSIGRKIAEGREVKPGQVALLRFAGSESIDLHPDGLMRDEGAPAAVHVEQLERAGDVPERALAPRERDGEKGLPRDARPQGAGGEPDLGTRGRPRNAIHTLEAGRERPLVASGIDHGHRTRVVEQDRMVDKCDPIASRREARSADEARRFVEDRSGRELETPSPTDVSHHGHRGAVGCPVSSGNVVQQLAMRAAGERQPREHRGGHTLPLVTGRVGTAEADQHLGMASLRERAELIGGTLTVTTVADQGTTVCVAVPLAD